MLNLNIKKYEILSVIAFLNAIPLISAALLPDVTMTQIFYFYWIEIIVMAAYVLVRNAKRLIVFFVLLLAAALIVHFTDSVPVGHLRFALTFWGLYGLCWVSYLHMVKSSFGLVLKRIHPLEQFLFYLFFMMASIAGCFALTAALYSRWDIIHMTEPLVLRIFMVTAIGVPTLSLGVLKIIDMIGPRHFLLFLLGAYHRPVEQDRIVLFLDMVDSSAIAETLEPRKSMALIARFIFDAMVIFRLHGGDVLNYTGDGLVVLWPRKGADRALSAIRALRRRLEQNAALYRKEFGVVPDFRVGIHAGNIVIAQIGEEKLFLGPYGDVVNTAARLEKMNKDFDTKILFSSDVLGTMKSRDNVRSLGKQGIRGKNEQVEVFTLGQERA